MLGSCTVIPSSDFSGGGTSILRFADGGERVATVGCCDPVEDATFVMEFVSARALTET